MPRANTITIKTLLLQKGLTQRDLVDGRVIRTDQMVSAVIHGRKQSAPAQRQIAQALGAPVRELFPAYPEDRLAA